MESYHQERAVDADVTETGMQRIRELIQEFLTTNEVNDDVKNFLRNASLDNKTILLYLRGRKYRPEQAWDTLKRKAELKTKYPDIHVPLPMQLFERVQKTGLCNLLRNRDKMGRRIICANIGIWDPDEYNLTDGLNFSCRLMDKMLLDKYAQENGIVAVVNVKGLRFYQAKHFGLQFFLKMINVLYNTTPVKIKGIYYVNVPSYLLFLYEILKPFLTKKLKERIIVTTASQKFEVLHANLEKEILPEYLGGDLDFNEAVEFIDFNAN